MAQAQAYDSLFIVEDVVVDVTAENSVVAQERALDEAQVKAFEVLAARMVDEAQVASVSTPDPLTISSMVKDFEVTNEQLSAVRYIGTYTVRFREDAVSKFFSVSGVKYTDTSSKPLLILPIFQKDGKNTIWAENNSWMQGWARAKLPNGLVPVEVPIGDLADITDIDDRHALSYDRMSLDRMLARYNAKEAAIMVAVPDMTLSNLAGDQKAIGRLRISIYHTDRDQAEHVQDFELESDGTETVTAVYDRAVRKAYAVLQKDWKKQTLASAAENQMFHVRVPFKTLLEWTKIHQVLKGITGVSDVSVLSMKKIEARVSFNFRGDEVRLRDLLQRSALSLGQGYTNGTAYKFTENQKNAPNLLYDLTYSKGADAQSGSFYHGVEPAAGAQTQTNNPNVHTF